MTSVGLISRRVDRADGRRLVLRLSRRGVEAYRQIVPLARAIEAALLEGLTARERHFLRSAGQKVLRRAEAILPEGVEWRSFLG
jgi:DNA-binding MarR family transcriptional regulator